MSDRKSVRAKKPKGEARGMFSMTGMRMRGSGRARSPMLGGAVSLLVAGCSAASATPDGVPPPPSSSATAADRVPWFLAVDAHGAVVLDNSTGTLRGFDRARGRVWEDTREPETSVV